MTAVACDECRRVHLGPACTEQRPSVQVTVTIPAWVVDRLRAHVPWGSRSGWVARLIERELNREAQG